MSAFNENPIVTYLNSKKTAIDKGRFVDGEVLNVDANKLKVLNQYTDKRKELNRENRAQTLKDAIDAIKDAVKTQLRIDDTIKLIILTAIRENNVVLICNTFLNNNVSAIKLQNEKHVKSLNHVIIGKTGNIYAIIGYIEDTTKGTQSRPAAPCYSFKLDAAGKPNTCALLPNIIKKIIFGCVTQYYSNQKVPDVIATYYNPVRTDIETEVKEEAAAEAEAGAAEVTEEDKCDFKGLLRSKIKNEEGYDYCKITDRGLLDKIRENVNIKGTNDLIKSSLDAKKEETETEIEEKEGVELVSDASLIAKKEAQMIEEGNEMLMISLEVLLKIKKGSTYSSVEFFQKYLNGEELNVDKIEEKAAEVQAGDTLAQEEQPTTDQEAADQEAAQQEKLKKEREKFNKKIQQLQTLKDRFKQQQQQQMPQVVVAAVVPAAEKATPEAAPAVVPAAAVTKKIKKVQSDGLLFGYQPQPLQEEYKLLTPDYVENNINSIVGKDLYIKQADKYTNRGKINSASMNKEDQDSIFAYLILNNDTDEYITNDNNEYYIKTVS